MTEAINAARKELKCAQNVRSDETSRRGRGSSWPSGDRQGVRYRSNRQLVPLLALATPEISANALRVAAIRGRLKAAKAADGMWRSSRAWVEEYTAARYTRR